MRHVLYLLTAGLLPLTPIMSATHSPQKPAPDAGHYLVYVGTYGKGVYGFRFDAASGKAEALGMVGAVVNPSWVASDPDHRYLYAVSELEGNAEGAVAAFSMDRRSGALKPLNTRPSGGVAPCYVVVDQTGKAVIVANYVTGGVSSFPIESDGRLGPMASLMTAKGSSVNKERQEGPHAHEVVISAANRAYVPDLGLDHIRIYKLDAASAKLTPNDPAFAQGPPGLGPRHMLFSHDEKYAYVLNEIEPFITIFRHDRSNGSLHMIRKVATLPEDFKGENTGAEIVLDRAGKYLYTSNRGHDSLQVFAVDSNDGGLRRIQIISTGGKTPRGFAIDPDGRFLLAGNQDSNQLVLFKVNSETGKLTDTGQKFEVPKPVDVLFVPAE